MGSKLLKKSAELSTMLARELVEKGFEHGKIKEIIIDKTPYRGREIKKFEDILFKKIEKFSEYLYVVNTETKEDYCYFTVRDLHEDTGLKLSSINGSINTGYLANSVFKIDRLAFTSKELCQDKTYLFEKKIGKVKLKKDHVRSGKYISRPLRVTDTYSDTVKEYEEARLFCEEINLQSKDLSKYILNGCRIKRRYEIEPL